MFSMIPTNNIFAIFFVSIAATTKRPEKELLAQSPFFPKPPHYLVLINIGAYDWENCYLIVKWRIRFRRKSRRQIKH